MIDGRQIDVFECPLQAARRRLRLATSQQKKRLAWLRVAAEGVRVTERGLSSDRIANSETYLAQLQIGIGGISDEEVFEFSPAARPPARRQPRRRAAA